MPMNDDVIALLHDVVGQLEERIEAQQCPAIVALEGKRRLVLTDYDYPHDPTAAEAFERRAADHAKQIDVTRWVFAVPQVWVINEHDIEVRAVSPHPIRDGEQEAITWMAYDETEGVDYGRVPYARRPNGEPVFDDPQILTVDLYPGEKMPGYTLLRALVDMEPPAT